MLHKHHNLSQLPFRIFNNKVFDILYINICFLSLLLPPKIKSTLRPTVFKTSYEAYQVLNIIPFHNSLDSQSTPGLFVSELYCHKKEQYTSPLFHCLIIRFASFNGDCLHEA